MSGRWGTQAREGLWSVHGAIVLMGGTALFAKWIELPALEITLLRSVFAAAVLFAYLKWRAMALRLPLRRDYYVAALLGTLLALHWSTYFHAMQVSTVAVGIIALHTFPVMTVFLEPLFHGARPRRRDVLAALLVLLGVYLLVPSFELDNAALQGVLWGCLSAFLYALRNVLQRHYFYATPASHSLLYQALAVIVVLLPFGLDWTGGNAGLAAVTSLQWLQLLLLGVFFTALPHAMFAHSLRFLPAKSASLVACLQVVYATALAALLLGEIPEPATVLGGVLVIGASVYESYGVGRPARPARQTDPRS